ncbi:FERM domain-containing protein 5 [Chionoecetes opilio]|uniref:Moesin/ezrin/radixin homolog 1 n=1 Tax=Chionoecetes opilio TaxID=41210 RepID=A0A8J4YDH6_CHIOP|nr:FERM domain-containing protein 5 [Chionoecetes opilio]
MLKLGSKKDHGIDYRCTIRLLDDNEVLECEFQSYHKGKVLLDFVFNRLDLVETDYFALRYIDQNKQRHWLDPNKNILRQIKNLAPILFCFRVKFYPADPLRLQEEITRYQLFLQLRRDLLHGRLYCSQGDAVILAAYTIQAEIGDYDPTKHYGNYISDFKILLKQTQKIDEKIMELHPTFKKHTPLMAETGFLKKAAVLDTYGVDPHPVKGPSPYTGPGPLTLHRPRAPHLTPAQGPSPYSGPGPLTLHRPRAPHLTLAQGPSPYTGPGPLTLHRPRAPHLTLAQGPSPYTGPGPLTLHRPRAPHLTLAQGPSPYTGPGPRIS